MPIKAMTTAAKTIQFRFNPHYLLLAWPPDGKRSWNMLFQFLPTDPFSMPDRASPDTQTPELWFAGGYFNLLDAFYIEKCLSKKY
jgi:hypothetical protein